MAESSVKIEITGHEQLIACVDNYGRLTQQLETRLEENTRWRKIETGAMLFVFFACCVFSLVSRC